MKIKECYELFLKTFPDAYDVTETAFRNERSRIGAIADKYKTRTKNHGTRTPKPLFSEQTKKGYVRIKIGQPNVWMFKHHYVWWQNTGHKPEPRKETVIFLDGNNRNFDFNNLFLMPRACCGIFNNTALHLGLVPGNPEATRINATNAILVYKTHQIGRELGLVSEKTGRFKSDLNQYQKNRIKNLTPEQKELEKEKRRKYFERIRNDPEKHQEFRRKKNEYYKKWIERKRNN